MGVLFALSDRGDLDTVDHVEVYLRIKELSDKKLVDQILQNYAIHYVMQSGQTFSSEGVAENIQQLLIRLALFRIVLAGLMSQCETLSSEQVVQMIQRFVKYYEHDSKFKTSMSEIFGDSDEMQVVDYLALIV